MLGLGGLIGIAGAWAALYGLGAWLYHRGTMRRDWHRDVLAVGVLVLATLGFFWPLFFTQSWIPKGGGDLASFIYPIYAFAARWLKRGTIPLWNPHLYMGMPFAADNQSGLLYPVNLIFFLLTTQLTYEAVELMAVTHVFLAGLFTYALLRDLPSPRLTGDPTGLATIGRIPAVAGAIAFMFSDLFVVHLGNLNIIATATWLPLALLCIRRATFRFESPDREGRGGWAWAGWSGVVLGIAALVGHAQMFLYVGMAVALYTLFHMYVHRQAGPKMALAQAGKLLLAGIIAFGLAAISLIPAYDLTQYTVRASLTYAQASEFAIPPAGLVSLLTPGFFGRGTGPFWGPWLRTEMGYVGVLPLMLAAIAVVLTFQRYALSRFWLILGALGLLIALGGHTVLHGWTFALIPFFRQLRVPARAIFAFDLAVAVLAAEGLDVLMHPLSHQARQMLRSLNRALLWIGGALTLVGVPLMGHAVLQSRLSPPDILAQTAGSMGSLIFFLILFAAGVGWLAMRRYELVQPTALGVLAVCLIAFDLISLGAYVEIEPNDPLVGYQPDQTMAFLKADPDVFRVEVLPGAPGGWASDWALIHEMDDWGGIWNPLRLGAYDTLTWAGIDRETPYYDLYNCKYVIAHQDTAVPARFEPVFREGEQVVYVNPRAVPRAFMVYRTQIASGQKKALNMAKAPDFDPASRVVLERQSGASPLEASPGDGEWDVAIVDRGPNHLDLHVVTSAEGYLVISEMWMPGWVASMDGAKSEVLRANYTFHAVHIPPGTHDVHMVYKPRPWFVGLGITLATLAALAAWGACALIRRRRRA